MLLHVLQSSNTLALLIAVSNAVVWHKRSLVTSKDFVLVGRIGDEEGWFLHQYI